RRRHSHILLKLLDGVEESKIVHVEVSVGLIHCLCFLTPVSLHRRHNEERGTSDLIAHLRYDVQLIVGTS
ncbi:unnamed protein product, partial [Discosporangium mesarthrocarpum]